MLNDEEKFREYVREHPDQVFVNQKNLFTLDDYEIEQIGYAAVIILDDRIQETSGSYTMYEESMSQCIALTRTYYQEKQDIEPSEDIEDLVTEIFETAEDELDEFAALEVLMPFIKQVQHDCRILSSLHDNIFEEPYFQVLLEGPKQNRFWISKYNDR